jgi:RNA polymerase sigma-B factor
VVAAGPLATGLGRAEALLARWSGLAPGDARWAAARAEVIEAYLPLAAYLAHRFANRGEPLADLTQVATVGLIKAVDRFDASRGVPFASFATPTIVGELKRYFRDTAWSLRVPREFKELALNLWAASEELAQVLRHSPTTAELAVRLEVSAEDVRAARLATNAYRTTSLDDTPREDDRYLVDTLGGLDPHIAAAEWHEVLRLALAELRPQDRRAIGLRFFAELTQAQIGAELGVSQMQVSRLLTRALARLRAVMLGEDAGHRAARSG